MDYNDLYPNDHLMTNPNDYQSQTKLGHMLEDIQFNLQTGLDNVAQNIGTAYDNLKQNINENNNLYDNEVNPISKLDLTQPWNQNNNYLTINPPIIDLGPLAENIISNVKNWWEDLKANSQQQSLDNYQEYPTIETGFQPLQINPLIEPPPAQLEYVNQNSIIHEELAGKERRIRELEYAHVEDAKRLAQSENKQLDDRKKIQHLGKEIEKLKKNPFLKWWERATEDSKKERIF